MQCRPNWFPMRLPVAVSMLQNPNPRPIWVTEGAPPLVGHARQRECALLDSPYWVLTRQGISASCLLAAARVALKAGAVIFIDCPQSVRSDDHSKLY